MTGATPTEAPTISDTGDHDRCAHIIAASDIPRARAGELVTALCGKRWRPDRNPNEFPICQTCARIRQDMIGRSRSAPLN